MQRKIYCPHCGQGLGVTTEWADSTLECPHCRGRFTLPAEVFHARVPEPTSEHGTPPPPPGGAASAGPPPPPPPTWHHQQSPATQVPSRTSGKAIASLVLGICSIAIPPVGLILGIIALALAHSARNEIAYSVDLGGNGLATAGTVLGILGIVVNLGVCGSCLPLYL